MSNFRTPIKDVVYKYGVSPFQREGDWVCNYCQNLNFAFRKKCNRCKMQTREQNEQSLPYYYQYQYYYPRQTQPLQPLTNNQEQIHTTPPRKRKDQSNASTQKNLNTALPSVSPLVKKYQTVRQEKQKVNLENHRAQREDQNGYRLMPGEDCWEKQFEGFCYDDTPNQETNQPEDETDNQDIEQMMKNILV